MGITTAVINLFAVAGLVAALVNSPQRARKAIIVAMRAFVGILPMVLAIIVLIGLLLAFVPPHTIAAVAGGLLYAFPEQTPEVIANSRSFLIETISILPAVVILMGLFSVFVSQEVIARYLGSGSGVRGFFLAGGLGSLPTGPLYVAFPIVRAMRAKGAGIANMIGFLTAWASIKLPQEIIELRFLGPAFTITRLALTLAAAALMGVIAERVLRQE